MKRSTLFITYDGLLDQLGGSQILPYIYSISEHPRRIHILSFEKAENFSIGAEELQADLQRRGIGWTPLPFTRRFGKLGKAWDLLRMYGTSLLLQLKLRFGIVHCRSYQAMQVGTLLRRLTGVRTIFDMRGLWVDERVDGGLWGQERWFNRVAYFHYKRIERVLLASASHVVALTDQVVPELHRLSPRMGAQVSVIPCCADFDHFRIPSEAERQATRSALGVSGDGLILSYLGSLGTWYMLDEMLSLFAAAAQRSEDVHMLFVTRDWRDEHEERLNTLGLGGLRHRIHVKAAKRAQVPMVLGAADIMLSFIKPAYSKMASSPTKLAEAFAMGIPVISNSGVGDVERITSELDAGAVIDLDDSDAIGQLVGQLDVVCSKGGPALRARARKRFGLEVAEESYRQVYASLDCAP